MVKACIYLLWFPGTSYYYIGSTSQFPKVRFAKHLVELKSGTHHNTRVDRCYKKYGKPNFMVLEEVPVDIKFDREQEYIDLFGADDYCLNLNKKANSAFSGLKKEQYSILLSIKNVVSGEVIENYQGSISSLAQQLKLDQFHLAEVLRGNLKSTGNWILSTSDYQPIRAKYLGKKIQRGSDIIVVDSDISSLSNQLGISGTHLGDLLRGKVKTAKGWVLI